MSFKDEIWIFTPRSVGIVLMSSWKETRVHAELLLGLIKMTSDLLSPTMDIQSLEATLGSRETTGNDPEIFPTFTVWINKQETFNLFLTGSELPPVWIFMNVLDYFIGSCSCRWITTPLLPMMHLFMIQEKHSSHLSPLEEDGAFCV